MKVAVFKESLLNNDEVTNKISSSFLWGMAKDNDLDIRTLDVSKDFSKAKVNEAVDFADFIIIVSHIPDWGIPGGTCDVMQLCGKRIKEKNYHDKQVVIIYAAEGSCAETHTTTVYRVLDYHLYGVIRHYLYLYQVDAMTEDILSALEEAGEEYAEKKAFSKETYIKVTKRAMSFDEYKEFRINKK